MMKKLQRKKSVQIHYITFQTDGPITAQLYNTGKILVALQSNYLLHYVAYPISEANPSAPFNLSIKRDGEQMSWMMGNKFYEVARIKRNTIENLIGQYHSWRLKLRKTARKLADNSTYLHSDIFKWNTSKLQGNEPVLVDQLRENISFFMSDQKSSKTDGRINYQR